MTTRNPMTYDAFVDLATADAAVVGLVLKGSRAHEGMTTEHSDHDLYVVLADDATTDLTRFTGHRTPELDLVVLSLDEFRAAGGPGHHHTDVEDLSPCGSKEMIKDSITLFVSEV